MSINRCGIKPQDFQKLSSKLLYIFISKYKGDWNSIPHTHRFAELFYVVSGKGKFWLESKTYPTSPNDLIAAPPNMGHTELSYNTNSLGCIALGIEGITLLDPETSSNHDIYSYPERTEPFNLLSLILKEVQDRQPGYHLVCQNLLDVLLIRIIRRQKLALVLISFTKMTKGCRQIKQYLDSDYADNISLGSLAAMVHMNKYYLVHAFTKYMGLSPINHLNVKRLESSQDLLTSTDFSIAQIASSVGLFSQPYFSQAFRKEMNTTPSEHRKRKSTESESETLS